MAYHHLAAVYDTLMRDAPYDAWLRWLDAQLAADSRLQSEDVTAISGHDRGEGTEEGTDALFAAQSRSTVPLTIIELGCGTGSMTIPLAKRGYRMIGVDVSPEMLAIASEKMRAAKTEVTWVEQDMRQLALEPCDLVISFCDSLSYLLEEADVRQTFHRVYEHLRPGGRFFFDVHSPYQILHGYGENTFTLLDEEISYIWQCVCDPERLEVEHQLCFFLRQPNGLYRRVEEVHQQRAYQPTAMVKWLQEAGFADIVITADFQNKPPHAKSERLFYAARKPR